MATGDGDDLFGLALQYKRHEKVEGVDVTGDISLEKFVCNGVKLLMLFPSVEQRPLTLKIDQRAVDLQFTNGRISVELGGETCVGYHVFYATVFYNVGSVGSGLLQAT